MARYKQRCMELQQEVEKLKSNPPPLNHKDLIEWHLDAAETLIEAAKVVAEIGCKESENQ